MKSLKDKIVKNDATKFGEKVYMIWSLVNDSLSFFKILLYVIKTEKIK